MSDTPEPLAAILAEMRSDADVAALAFLTPDGLREYADRIEAAVAREREIARDLGRIDRESDNMARAADALEKAIAPGNAAALRDALETMVDCIDWLCEGDDSGRIRKQFAPLLTTARAALAAPARNCDRYADATEMARAFLKDPYSTLGRDSLVEVAHRFAEWAFAPSEGGQP